jgi:4-carboxymuconolactone decarboxylase
MTRQQEMADHRNEQDSRMKAGLEVLEQLGWGTNEPVHELDEDLWQIATATNFGTIWSRPGLALRDREVACIAMLLALGAPGVSIHFRNAKTVGITDVELKELVLQSIPYAGLPKALQAMAILRRTQAGEVPKL